MIDREFLRGFVKLYALWRSTKGGVYGAQILEEMQALGFRLSPGTLYPTLHKLLREQDVAVTSRVINGRMRKVYRAPPKGRRELDEIRERLKVFVAKVFK